MKKPIVIISMLFLGALAWQCSESKDPSTNLSPDDASVKSSLQVGAENISEAINTISTTTGYQLLNLTDEVLKTTSVDEIEYFDSIVLSQVSGVYEYKPLVEERKHGKHLYRLFEKTGEDEMLIIKLPEEKAFRPYLLRHAQSGDTLLENNFVITASDYHYYYSRGFIFDYKLVAGLTLDEEDAGSIFIESSAESPQTFDYEASYTFGEGYAVNLEIEAGDTTKSTYTLTQDDNVIFAETLLRIKTDSCRYRDKEYSLIIGNVEIKKYTATDSVEVYLDGILQENAIVELVCNSDDNDECTLCRRKLDIKITFDDDSSILLSELLGESIDELGALFASLRSVYFASNLVDYVAWNIYINLEEDTE